MTTTRIRSLVSLATALSVSLTVGGCASHPSHSALDELAAVETQTLTVHFDNGAREYVRVYLVGEQREWLLGRVEPGARATLRLPEAALAENAGTLRLAVLMGGRMTQRAASEAGVATSMAQPASELVAQRWTFSQLLATAQLTSLRLDSKGQAR